MSEATPASAPASAEAQSPNSAVNEANLPVEGEMTTDLDAAVKEAVQQADAKAKAKEGEEKQEEKSVKEKTDEELLEDFTKLWKSKKGKEVLKVNGKQREIQDYNEMVRLAQLGLAANEKFQQASESMKQAQALTELLQKDPVKALSKLGINMRDLAENFLVEEIKKEQMTPEQRELIEYKEKVRQYEEEKRREAEALQQQKLEELTTQYEQDITNRIIDAIETYKLPKNEKVLYRFADKMHTALELYGYELDPKDVAMQIRQELEDEHKSLYSQLDVDDLLKIIGEDNLKKIRQYELQKAKSKMVEPPTKTTPVATAKASEEPAPKKKRTMAEFEDYLNKLK